MMNSWMNETQELLREALDEQRKAEQKLEFAKRAVEEALSKVQALRTSIDLYKAKYADTTYIAEAVADFMRADEYKNLSVEGMLVHWGKSHNGRVIMKDIAKFLTAVKLFSDERQAAGSLYSSARRSSELRKVKRGVYVLADEPGKEQESVDRATAGAGMLNIGKPLVVKVNETDA